MECQTLLLAAIGCLLLACTQVRAECADDDAAGKALGASMAAGFTTCSQLTGAIPSICMYVSSFCQKSCSGTGADNDAFLVQNVPVLLPSVLTDCATIQSLTGVCSLSPFDTAFSEACPVTCDACGDTMTMPSTIPTTTAPSAVVGCAYAKNSGCDPAEEVFCDDFQIGECVEVTVAGITGFARMDIVSPGKLGFGFGLSENSCSQKLLIPIVESASYGACTTVGKAGFVTIDLDFRASLPETTTLSPITSDGITPPTLATRPTSSSTATGVADTCRAFAEGNPGHFCFPARRRRKLLLTCDWESGYEMKRDPTAPAGCDCDYCVFVGVHSTLPTSPSTTHPPTPISPGSPTTTHPPTPTFPGSPTTTPNAVRCTDSMYLFDGTCVESCPAHKIAWGVRKNGRECRNPFVCDEVDGCDCPDMGGCGRCMIDLGGVTCQACKTNRFSVGGKCVKEVLCKGGKYDGTDQACNCKNGEEKNRNCHKCILSGGDAARVARCVNCKNDKYLHPSTDLCVEENECPEGTFPTGANAFGRICTKPFTCKNRKAVDGSKIGHKCSCTDKKFCHTCTWDERGSTCVRCKGKQYATPEGTCAADCSDYPELTAGGSRGTDRVCAKAYVCELDKENSPKSWISSVTGENCKCTDKKLCTRCEFNAGNDAGTSVCTACSGKYQPIGAGTKCVKP